VTFEVVKDNARIENLTDVLTRPEELPDVESFRLAAYNVHNLFGEKPDVHSPRPDPPAPEEQLDALGEMIRNIEPDVIVFEEVQNEKVLADLFRTRVNRRIKDRKFRFNTFVCIPARDPRGINVALATRLAVRGSLTFHDREFGPAKARAVRFSRDLLGVELLATKKYRFLCFVAHLKSKMGGEASAHKRGLEAKEIRSIFEKPPFGGGKRYIDQDMVLCGDMNEDPGERPIRILKSSRGKALIDVLKDEGPTYPTHTRYKKTRLDYIFASRSIQVEDAKVHREDEKLAREASDHFPISATIRVK